MEFPVFDLGRYPNTWVQDGMLFGRSTSGIYGVIDPMTEPGKTLMDRRASFYAKRKKQAAPLTPLSRAATEFTSLIIDIVAQRVTKVIDNKGNILLLNQREPAFILSRPLASFSHHGDFVALKFEGTRQRVKVTAVPSSIKKFGIFMYHKVYGEVFLGLSENLAPKTKVMA